MVVASSWTFFAWKGLYSDYLDLDLLFSQIHMVFQDTRSEQIIFTADILHVADRAERGFEGAHRVADGDLAGANRHRGRPTRPSRPQGQTLRGQDAEAARGERLDSLHR